MNHTPAPWTRYGSRIRSHSGTVCSFRESTIDDPMEMEANMRLVASAPALLAACKVLCRSIERLWNEATDEEMGKCSEPGYKEAIAAISEVEGQP